MKWTEFRQYKGWRILNLVDEMHALKVNSLCCFPVFNMCLKGKGLVNEKNMIRNLLGCVSIILRCTVSFEQRKGEKLLNLYSIDHVVHIRSCIKVINKSNVLRWSIQVILWTMKTKTNKRKVQKEKIPFLCASNLHKEDYEQLQVSISQFFLSYQG